MRTAWFLEVGASCKGQTVSSAIQGAALGRISEDILADLGLSSADEHKKVEPGGVSRIE